MSLSVKIRCAMFQTLIAGIEDTLAQSVPSHIVPLPERIVKVDDSEGYPITIEEHKEYATVSFGYRGTGVTAAHEDLSQQESKFLERAWQERKQKILQDMADTGTTALRKAARG